MEFYYVGEQPCKTDLMVSSHFREGVEDDQRQLSFAEVFIIPDHVPQKTEMHKDVILQ